MDFFPPDHEMLVHERGLWADGVLLVAGVDEAGRGPLAGPVVAAAVVFPAGGAVPFVNDSKQLSAKRRAEILERILNCPGVDYAIVEVGVEEIDRINILEASRLAMRLAVSKLKAPGFALIDGLPVPDFPIPCLAVVKGDAKCACVAAASILAKQRRDALMDAMAQVYPDYGFERHKGYGTADHLEALRRHGPCPEHRRSFRPVRDILDPPPFQPDFFSTP